MHSFKSHYIYDKSENNKGVFFSTMGQRCPSLASACDGTRRYTSFRRPSSSPLPRKFSFTCTTYKYTYIEKTMQRCVYFVYSVGCLIHHSTFCYPFTYRRTEVENVSANVRCLVFFLLFLFVRNNRCFPILLEVSSPAGEVHIIRWESRKCCRRLRRSKLRIEYRMLDLCALSVDSLVYRHLWRARDVVLVAMSSMCPSSNAVNAGNSPNAWFRTARQSSMPKVSCVLGFWFL